MGDVVNLRLARKAKARVEREREAETNRTLHGRSKAQRKLAAAQANIEALRLDGHRREIIPGKGEDGGTLI